MNCEFCNFKELTIKNKYGWGAASFLCGFLTLFLIGDWIFGWMPHWVSPNLGSVLSFFCPLILSIISFIFGIIGFKKKDTRFLSIFGIFFSLVGFTLWIILTLALMGALQH